MAGAKATVHAIATEQLKGLVKNNIDHRFIEARKKHNYSF